MTIFLMATARRQAFRTAMLTALMIAWLPSKLAAATYFVDWSLNTVSNLTIQVGDTVRWTWGDAFPHSVVTTGGVESFDSGVFSGAGTIFEYTFNNPGVTNYICGIHVSTMTGSVTVEFPSPTITQTFTDSPTATATPSASPTATISPTFTDSPTYTFSPTISPTENPSFTRTFTPTTTPTATASPTASPSATPTISGTATWTPTASPSGTQTPPSVSLAFPHLRAPMVAPNPVSSSILRVSAEFLGAADSVTVRVYSAGFTKVTESDLGALPRGLQQLVLPLEPGIKSGTYYVVVVTELSGKRGLSSIIPFYYLKP